jgi:hypothetical protein
LINLDSARGEVGIEKRGSILSNSKFIKNALETFDDDSPKTIVRRIRESIKDPETLNSFDNLLAEMEKHKKSNGKAKPEPTMKQMLVAELDMDEF